MRAHRGQRRRNALRHYIAAFNITNSMADLYCEMITEGQISPLRARQLMDGYYNNEQAAELRCKFKPCHKEI